MKKLVLAVLLGIFVCAFMVVAVKMGTSQAPEREVKPDHPTVFGGILYVRSIGELWIGNTRIVLCGVQPVQGVANLATTTARRDFQGKTMTCKPIGTGTPCDGTTAPKFNGATVAQCFLPDGADLAAKLVENGLLCGLPAQAGNTYKTCIH